MHHNSRWSALSGEEEWKRYLCNRLCPSANRKASIKLKELLPQAELHIIAGAGHEINKVAPKEIASILNESIIKTNTEPLLFP